MGILQLEPTAIAQWRTLVAECQHNLGFSLTETLENYLVLTLDAFTAQVNIASAVIAIDYLRNIRVESLNNVRQLRVVGDQCLILSGLFPERALRKRVSADYFIDLGRNAYYVLSYTPLAYEQNRSLFYQLFDGFLELTAVLAAMRWPVAKNTHCKF